MQHKQLIDHRGVVAIKEESFDQQQPPIDLFSHAELFVEEKLNQKVRLEVITRRQIIEG
jgi:hypothetical protein